MAKKQDPRAMLRAIHAANHAGGPLPPLSTLPPEVKPRTKYALPDRHHGCWGEMGTVLFSDPAGGRLGRYWLLEPRVSMCERTPCFAHDHYYTRYIKPLSRMVRFQVFDPSGEMLARPTFVEPDGNIFDRYVSRGASTPGSDYSEIRNWYFDARGGSNTRHLGRRGVNVLFSGAAAARLWDLAERIFQEGISSE